MKNLAKSYRIIHQYQLLSSKKALVKDHELDFGIKFEMQIA
jgi:hypothetical protein